MKKYWWDYFTEELVDQKDPYSAPERYKEISAHDADCYIVYYREWRDKSQCVAFSYTKECIDDLGYEKIMSIALEDYGLTADDLEDLPYKTVVPKKELKKMIKEYGLEEDDQ